MCDYEGKNFAPRVGAAYRTLDNRTVVHAGYGIFYNISPINSSCGSGQALWAFLEAFEPFVAKTLESPFPNSAQVFAPPYNVPSQNRSAYIQQYNLGVQRQLTKTIVLELGYLGSLGTRLSVPLNLNQGEMALGIDPATGDYRRPFASLGFGSGLSKTAYEARSNYNGLLVRVEQRASAGLSFLASYTYSKSMDDNSAGIRPILR